MEQKCQSRIVGGIANALNEEHSANHRDHGTSYCTHFSRPFHHALERRDDLVGVAQMMQMGRLATDEVAEEKEKHAHHSRHLVGEEREREQNPPANQRITAAQVTRNPVKHGTNLHN
jgi:hypothetical protein